MDIVCLWKSNHPRKELLVHCNSHHDNSIMNHVNVGNIACGEKLYCTYRTVDIYIDGD